MASVISTPIAVVLVAATIAAWTDLRRFRVYNALTVPLALSGLVYHIWMEGGPGLATSLGGLLLGFGLLIVPYICRLMGAGDVKLMSGIGAWLGPGLLLQVFAATSLVAGLVALVMMAYRGKLRESWVTLQVIWMRLAVLGTHFGQDDLLESALHAPDRRLRALPFAAAVPFGVLAVLVFMKHFTT